MCLFDSSRRFILWGIWLSGYIQYRKTSITYRDSSLSSIEKELYCLWNNLKLISPKEEKEMYQVFTFLMTAIVAATDYSIFFRQKCDYLYPYLNVKREVILLFMELEN